MSYDPSSPVYAWRDDVSADLSDDSSQGSEHTWYGSASPGPAEDEESDQDRPAQPGPAEDEESDQDRPAQPWLVVNLV